VIESIGARQQGRFLMPSNKQNGGRKGNGGGPSGRPHNQPDLKELLKRGRDKLKQAIPGGSGLPGPLNFLVVIVLAAIVGFYAFTFRVNPDELGVVLRFGEVSRQEPPGLHFRLPYPIDEVHLPKVTQQNIIEIVCAQLAGQRVVCVRCRRKA
jgi:membrane protease subunit HflK